MALVKQTNLLILFLIEAAVLVAAFSFGWHQHTNVAVRVVIGVVLALVFAMSWGRAAAPRAKNRLGGASLAVFKTAWFAVAVGLLFAASHPAWAIALAAVALVTNLLAVVWHQSSKLPAKQ